MSAPQLLGVCTATNMLDYEPKSIREARVREKRQLVGTMLAAALLIGSLARAWYDFDFFGTLGASVAVTLATALAGLLNLWAMRRASTVGEVESRTHACVRVSSSWIMWGGVIAVLADEEIAHWSLFASLGVVLCRYAIIMALPRYFESPPTKKTRHRHVPPWPP